MLKKSISNDVSLALLSKRTSRSSGLHWKTLALDHTADTSQPRTSRMSIRKLNLPGILKRNEISIRIDKKH